MEAGGQEDLTADVYSKVCMIKEYMYSLTILKLETYLEMNIESVA